MSEVNTAAPPKADRVLLVDDEEGIRTVLRITLEDMGYIVTTAASGHEALDLFEQSRPPIVLTDIKMPGMNGISLLREIKDLEPDTEVIMITGHGDMDLAVTSMQYGSADFISKPVGTDALEVALRRAEERIHLRRRIRQYTEDLERMVKERTDALLESERMAAVGRTVADLSHTIKNLASGLEGGIYVLGKGIELDDKKYLTHGWEMVQGNVEKVKKLSLALLNFAKYGRVTPAPCDPAAPAREALDLMRGRAEQESILLTSDFSAAPAQANLDQDAMVRLLINLLENGMDAYAALPTLPEADEDETAASPGQPDYSPVNSPDSSPTEPTSGMASAAEGAAKTVELTVASEDGQLVYRVTDHGHGLSKEAEGQLLTGFFTTKGSAGTGIGLMTCRKIAEQHGGSIELADHPGGGVTATVRLPL